MRPSYWKWLFRGLNDKPGIYSFLNRWLLFHVIVGVVLAFLVYIPLHESARALVFPLGGIFIGLSFAWAGNAQALLQTDEIEQLFPFTPDGIVTYIYEFQTAILCILIALVSWGLAGLKVFDFCGNSILILIIEFFLFFLSSLAIRECWHVVLGSQTLVLIRSKVREEQKNKKTKTKKKVKQ